MERYRPRENAGENKIDINWRWGEKRRCGDGRGLRVRHWWRETVVGEWWLEL